MARTAADKQVSAVLSLLCLAIAVAIYLGIDSLTGGAWSEYLKIRAANRFKVEPIGYMEFPASPGAYPQPAGHGYGRSGPPVGGAAAPAPRRADEGALLWPPLLFFTIAAAFAATACYFFYRAFGPFFIEDADANPAGSEDSSG